MQSNEIRERFLKFFEKRRHKIVPSSSLVPEGDPSVLFTTAGMQQFKPYYLAPENALKDFGSQNVASVQKCVRTVDIDEVGDDTHLTFFEMLGNFSFGGYGKREAIEYAFDFITKEMGLEIDYVSVFEGDDETPADSESREIWASIDDTLKIKDHNREDNFWGPTGEEGPCGPTTEIYINGVEIWNIVFNEYYKTKDGTYKPLEAMGIDTGMGLERLLVQVQKKQNVYETDLFNNETIKEERIVADHTKAALFLVSDGVVPANTGAGYIVRRLIRKAIRFSQGQLSPEIERIKKVYKNVYHLEDDGEIEKEYEKFKQAIDLGVSTVGKITWDSIEELGKKITNIFQTLGLDIESSIEILRKQGHDITQGDESEIRKIFNEKSKQHQELSRTTSAGMFKGGLVNHDPETIRLHTAHHLLLSGLKEVIDEDIKQRGSNINEKRLRMDFLCDHKLTDEEKKKVEDWVNDKIKEGLSVVNREMPLEEAKKLGAEMEFGAKYPDVVSVYFIEDQDGDVISKEFCGGPHVSNTSELGHFKIKKEESVAKGIRRIKAVLE